MNAYRSPTLVRHDIERTRAQQAGLNPLPDRAVIKASIATLTAKATVDAGYKGELVLALNQLQQADKIHAEYKALGDHLLRLMDELSEAERQEGVAIRELASKRMQVALNEFNAHAKAATMAYAALIQQARTSGYSAALPKFDASTLRPISWQGPVSDIMQQASNPFRALPWMDDEREAA